MSDYGDKVVESMVMSALRASIGNDAGWRVYRKARGVIEVKDTETREVWQIQIVAAGTDEP